MVSASDHNSLSAAETFGGESTARSNNAPFNHQSLLKIGLRMPVGQVKKVEQIGVLENRFGSRM